MSHTSTTLSPLRLHFGVVAGGYGGGYGYGGGWGGGISLFPRFYSPPVFGFALPIGGFFNFLVRYSPGATLEAYDSFRCIRSTAAMCALGHRVCLHVCKPNGVQVSMEGIWHGNSVDH